MLPPASQQALDDARAAILAAIARQGVAQSRLEVRLQNLEIAMRAQSETFTKHRELVGLQATLHERQDQALGQLAHLINDVLATARRIEKRLTLIKSRDQ